MKSGPVFLWRGSVALLCEACQRLMIRWNIQTPATRRQAHWYVVIPNRGVSHADPQIFMHVHVLTKQTHTHVHARIHSHSSHFAKVLIYDSNMASRVYTVKWLEEKRMTEGFRDGNLAIDSCYVQEGGEKKWAAWKRFTPRLDEQIVNNSTCSIQDAHCDPWFFTSSKFC